MKKFLVILLVVVLIFGGVVMLGAKMIADEFIKTNIGYWLVEGDVTDKSGDNLLSSGQLEEIANKIPLKDKVALTYILTSNLDFSDILSLQKIATDQFGGLEEIIKEAKEYLKKLPPEDLNKIKEIYDKYIKSASVNP